MMEASVKASKDAHMAKWCAEHGHELLPAAVVTVVEGGVRRWPLVCVECHAEVDVVGPRDLKYPARTAPGCGNPENFWEGYGEG